MARKEIYKTILKSWVLNGNTNRAAAVAFYTIFSFSPLLILSFNLASLFWDKDIAKQEIINVLTKLISPDAGGLVQDIFNDPISQLGSSLLSLLILFYASSKIFSVLRSSFNKIFGTKESHKTKIMAFLEGEIISIILVPAACLFFLTSLFFNLLISKADLFFSTNGIPESYILILFFNYLLSFIVLASISFLLIKFLPTKNIPTKAALKGALVSAVFFELGRFILTLYLSHSFIKSFYGSMGSLVALMLWTYYSMQILLLGAEVAQYFTSEEKTLKSL